MSENLFFGEIEKQGEEARKKYMALRGKHGNTVDSSISNIEDLKKYNAEGSETQC